MNTLYFDCFSGAAGDMLIASVLDAGASVDVVRDTVARLHLEAVSVEASKEWRGGLAGTRFQVRTNPQAPRRHLPEIRQLLDRSSLPDSVKSSARLVFDNLGHAEAKVHGCALDDVHFHEVGAEDSLVDIVGFCALWHHLGTPSILVSPLAVGKGFVDTEHGKIPVPAMATLELLKGMPLETTSIPGELVTPTGAALLSTLGQEYGRGFSFVPCSIGYGLGTRDRSDPPNAVRAVFADREPFDQDRVVLLESNLDDATGEEVGRVLNLCLDAGALDALVVPAQMKKGRPGHLVQVQARQKDVDELQRLLLEETSTLGVRRRGVDRAVLRRRVERRETSFGPIRVKVAERPSGREELSLEFEDLDRLSRNIPMPLPELRRRLLQELRDDDATATQG